MAFTFKTSVAMPRVKRRIKLGIIANEFFDTRVGRMGGFGWAARQVALCFGEDPSLGIDVVFLAGDLTGAPGQREAVIHKTRLVLAQHRRLDQIRLVRSEGIDLLLSIDYRPTYRSLFRMLPRTPIIVWVRDPRTPADVRKVNTLRIPGAEDIPPQGIDPIDCTSLAHVARASRLLRRPLLLASKMSHLDEKIPDTYGVRASGLLLPNPQLLDCEPGQIVKSDRPRVLFLSRHDPIKRPWLFLALAQRFPHVEFLFAGQSHSQGAGAWRPDALPENVRLLGHVEGMEKVRLLSSAWVLVNTAIHEESPVSMFEALACETPILSCTDSGEITSRFGIYTGRFDGTGAESLAKFANGLNRLLRDDGLRVRLGKEGRQWVTATHGKAQFLEGFDELCRRAGVRR